LRACQKQGLRVVLASSADPAEFAVLRAALDADDAVDDATSSGDVDTAKPAPDLVQLALEKAGAPAAEAVFVGDTVWDVEACTRAGVACVAVLSGGISREELLGAGAVAVYHDTAELLAGLPGSLDPGHAEPDPGS
jgi:phosphoglycolate phosphatase-like HAD superfamily hydrolase